MKMPKIITVTDARYINKYTLLITFNDTIQKTVDFEKSLKKYAFGFCDKYLQLKNFKKFTVENGNLFWGKNWDIIYNNYDLYTGNIN